MVSAQENESHGSGSLKPFTERSATTYLVTTMLAAAALLGCSRGPAAYQASIDVVLLADVSSPQPLQQVMSTNWFNNQCKLIESDRVLGNVVDELKLADKWSGGGASISKADAIQRLRSSIHVQPDQSVRGFVLSVRDKDESETKALVKAVADQFKSRADEAASKLIADQLAQAEKESQATQEKLTALFSELHQMQTNLFVPSKYHLSKEYETKLQAEIQDAMKDESGRSNQLESLRKMQSDELRAALLKIELPRAASLQAAGTPSELLTRNQAQRAAQKELELAQSGSVAETNAVGHAQLKLEQANENLTNAMSAYLKSLEIETEVSKGRRQELQVQLEKLRTTSKLSERKTAITEEVAAINAKMAALSDSIEQWKLCQRMLNEGIRLGPVRTEPVKSR